MIGDRILQDIFVIEMFRSLSEISHFLTLLPASAILASCQFLQGIDVVNSSRWLKGSNLHLTYHVYQIRHDAFDLNNINVLNLQRKEKNYLIKIPRTMLEGSKGKKEKRSEGRRNWGRQGQTEGIKKSRTGRGVERRNREGTRKDERKREGLRRKLHYRNTLSLGSQTFSKLDSCRPTKHATKTSYETAREKM